jgi:cytochrome c5
MHTRNAMRRPAMIALALSVILALAASAVAQQVVIRLPADDASSQVPDGPGADAVRRDCAICHSLDYIVRQPRMEAAAWEAEVQKMIRVYGAPVVEADARIIAAYLARHFGPQSPAAQALSAP